MYNIDNNKSGDYEMNTKFSVKKLYAEIHKTDDGKTWAGSGFAVVNSKGEIVTEKAPEFCRFNRLINVYDYKYVAKKVAQAMNESETLE